MTHMDFADGEREIRPKYTRREWELKVIEDARLLMQGFSVRNELKWLIENEPTDEYFWSGRSILKALDDMHTVPWENRHNDDNLRCMCFSCQRIRNA